MNTELRLKLLQYLNQKKQASGLTFFQLITIIVVLEIAVILYFLQPPRPSKCKCSDGHPYVNILNKGQRAYYTEKSKFSTNIPDLGVGIRTTSITYNYYVKVIGHGTQAVAISYSATKNAALKNYVGYVSLIIPAGKHTTEVTSMEILCEQKTAGTLSLDIEWKPGIELPKCNKYQMQFGKKS